MIAAAFFANLPLGYLRQGARKFSAAWFAWIHVSIPFIVLLRFQLGISSWYIPLSIGAAVGGQLVGGRFRKSR
jgi:hypothetical protein